MTTRQPGEAPERDEGHSPAAGSPDALDAAFATLRRRRFEPPSDMVDRAVLRAVQARAAEAERKRTSLRRFVTPLATLGFLTLAFGGALVLMQRGDIAESRLQEQPSEALTPSITSPGEPTDPVPVRFVLPAAGARQVAVAGEFNDWDASRTLLNDDDGDGVFHATVSLERGAYAYMFVVDGERWVTDPFADAYRDDGFGNRNAVLRIP